MRKIIVFLSAVVLMLAAHNADAQVVRQGQTVGLSSVTPDEDHAAMLDMRTRMDVIRQTENRPTVALVLSGGGAKGGAHIGVMKYLEEQGIPVDMVLGTSIGGLMGGLCAMGYNPVWMDSLMRSLDWGVIMSDKIPVTYLSYNERKYKEKYIFNVPFYYRQKDSDGSEGIFLGADSDAGASTIKENLMGSLPSAYITGHNVSNLINKVTVGYHDDMSFLDFPIPFVCVATDMLSYRAKIWHSGDITKALRSTMSIPGVFAPVKTDGMVLVDGGMRNNFPTDIAREAGADIIIGVDLSDRALGYDEVNNLGDLLNQTIDMLGRDAFETNVGIPDVFIKPDLTGYGMMSFDKQSVADIIDRGYQAAVNNADAIRRVKRMVGPATKTLRNKPAIDLGSNSIAIDRICFEGLSVKDEKYILKNMPFDVGPSISYDDIESAVAMVYATGAFRSVTYELRGMDEPFELVIKCEKGPINRLGGGLRFDSETTVSTIFNLGFNTNTVSGSAFDLTAKLGSNPYADLHYRLNSTGGATVNADALFGFTDAKMFNYGSVRPDFNVDFWRFRQRLYFSNVHWSRFDVKFGATNEFVKVMSLIGDASTLDAYKEDYPSVFIDARFDTTHDSYFPESGHEFGLKADWMFKNLYGDDVRVGVVQIDWKKIHKMGSRLSLIPYLNARGVLSYNEEGLDNEVPQFYTNLVGGSMAGRYLDQQMPFIGINYAMPVGRYAAVAREEMRLKLGASHYVSLMANCVAATDGFENREGMDSLFKNGLFHYGAGIEYAYDSIIGPMKLDVHWSDVTNSLGAYFSMGFDF
ncbi:MAG: patatin-like phospholipase family protein [Bacteroidales bacterium]|nr:patatin-like phospholipase family protein [Bacteroidales bacterium]